MPQKKQLKSVFTTILLIIFILLATSLSRILIFNHVFSSTPLSVERGDTSRYEEPALNLLTHGSLAINPTDPHTTALSTTPIYSLLIAASYKIFGLNNRYSMIIIQILLSSLTLLIVFLTTKQIWTKKVAFIAMTLMALEPLQTLYSQIILSETLFTLFLASSLFALSKLVLTQDKMRWALILGITITLATMTRPISYYLVFCFVLGLAVFKPYVAKSWLELGRITLLILIPLLLTTTAWKVRNENLTGVYVLNDAMNETLLYYKAKGVLMVGKSLTQEEAHQEILQRLSSGISTTKEQVEEESKLAKEIILNDPKSYFKLAMTGLKAIIFGPGLTSQAQFYDNKEEGRTNTGYKLWYLLLIGYGIAFMLLSYLFSIYGFIRSLNKSTKQEMTLHLLMLGVVTYFILISTGHIATDSRMRVPIIPIILIYASYGVFSLLEALKFRKIRKSE